MRFLPSLLALSLLAAGPAGAASVCRTNGSGLNLRSSGSLHARRQATLPAGASFDVIGTSANGRWLRVRAGGRTGWVYGSYVCGGAVPDAGGGGNSPILPGDSGTAAGGTPGSGSPLTGGSDATARDGATVGSRAATATGVAGSSTPGSSSPGSPSPDSASPGSSASGAASPDSASPGAAAASAPLTRSAPVTASPAECAAPRAEPAAIEPLEGIDPFCESCVASRLESFGRMLDDAARQQASVARVQDTLAAVLAAEETGSRTPDWSSITVDSGGLTYGAYQADRRSGELAKLIRQYVANAPSTPETRALARHAAMLEGGRGAALDRSAELKNLLRKAGNDPVMQRTQADFFRQHHLEPALAKAAAAGIRSPLGASIWLDLLVNGGLDAVVAAAKRVVPRVQSPADEARFLRALVDAREQRYRRLAARGLRKYLPGWLSRNEDFRKLLDAGSLDLAGNVPLAAKGFSLCGGSTADATAFRAWMASLARPS